MANIEGLAEITKALTSLIPTGDEIQSAFRSSADNILVQIKSELPKKSGLLADSYQYVKRKKSNGFTIGASYKKGGGNHAHLIELGFKTRNGGKVAGRFIERKVFDENKKQALDAMEKGLANIIEAKWNK